MQHRRIVLLALLVMPAAALRAAGRGGRARIGILSGLAAGPEAMRFLEPITARLVGGLASYQSDFAEALRRGAAIIDKVLRGAKPAEIPFEQATKLELVVNLKAAKALGIVVPASLLMAANEVIE